MDLGFHNKGSESKQTSAAGAGGTGRWQASLGAGARLVSAPAATWGARGLSWARLENSTCPASVDLTAAL